MPKRKVWIIGVSPEGAASLAVAARRRIARAEMVFGGERLLQMFPDARAEKVVIKNNLARISAQIGANLGRKSMVVLASGDPAFFGIARYLTAKMGKTAVEIAPNVSAMQLAFARVKESWDDAALVSVHSRPIEDIVETVRSSNKIGIFTDAKNTPDKIARVLLEHGIENCRAYICEDIGGKRERVLSTNLERLSGSAKLSPLSTMILIKDIKESPGPLLGTRDEAFSQQKGRSLITKLEVRAVSLAKLQIKESSTVWDVGAGSGAISIEASSLAGKGWVFAIEKDPANVAIIRKNIRKFGRYNIKVIETLAPDGLEMLPDPSAVFVGGSGGKMAEILDNICQRLKPGGRVVINVATLENLGRALDGLKANGFAAEVTQVNISRSKAIANLTRLEPLNPVFIVTGQRETTK